MSKLITENVLGEKHIVDIIVFLHTFGSRSKTEIYRAISTSPHMSKKLEKLEENGLVSTYNQNGSRKRLIQLTALGQSYADAICSLEDRSGGDMSMYKSDTVRDMLYQMERIDRYDMGKDEDRGGPSGPPDL